MYLFTNFFVYVHFDRDKKRGFGKVTTWEVSL